MPTYVQPTTEQYPEDSVQSFTQLKPSTDWAKKAVVQPPKLETAKVEKAQTCFEQKSVTEISLPPGHFLER